MDAPVHHGCVWVSRPASTRRDSAGLSGATHFISFALPLSHGAALFPCYTAVIHSASVILIDAPPQSNLEHAPSARVSVTTDNLTSSCACSGRAHREAGRGGGCHGNSETLQ